MTDHKIIYILRHGQTEYNKRKMVQGSGVDSDLNETGQQQANAFFEKYKSLPFELLYTSGLKRTQQTLKPFIDLGIPWLKRPTINEISWGRHEGLASTPEMIEQYRYVIQQWTMGNFQAAVDGGESAQQMARRLQRFVDELKQREEKKILVCAHGRAMRCLMCLLKEAPLNHMENFRHSNTGLYRVRFTGDTFLFELENDISHLDQD